MGFYFIPTMAAIAILKLNKTRSLLSPDYKTEIAILKLNKNAIAL
ncbi:MAG: hypothetical protein ACRC6M_06910 [Microcystaceae cyanobacterium]